MLTSFFVNKKGLIPSSKYIIKGKKYRFSLLSPRLIRLEYNERGVFEDRATQLVINRSFKDFKFNYTENEMSIQITTDYYTLTYVKEMPFSKGISVSVNNTKKVWKPGVSFVKNLGGLSYSLDDSPSKINFDNGLYSFDGFVSIDDSSNMVIDNESFVNRNNTVDTYLFVYNEDLGLCLQDYYNLTGYPLMLPRYAFGCWWYKNEKYNMHDVDNVINMFNKSGIPISLFMLGNKWHNNICNYSFDNTLFDLNALSSYFNNKGIKFGLTIDPSLGINNNDPLYGMLCNSLNNKNKWLSFIPLNNNSINAYLNMIISSLMNYGIDTFNIDYNNIKDRNGLFLLNHYHYVISSMNKRGLILSRNSGIAPHRYPVIFSGKTKVSWDTLKSLASYNNSAANIGVSWHAHAIGGYYDGIESEELFLRFIQFGTFNPIFILASDSGKFYKREPWKWNKEFFTIIKEYMVLRNKLVPYIYTESFLYHKFGIPFIQPLYYKYPKIYDDPNYVNQYFFGSRIMISPIIKKKNIEMDRVVQKIFIPDGIWYDYFSGKKFIGNKYYTSFYRIDDYPIFVKEGSIIPLSLDYDTGNPKNMEINIFPPENNLYGNYELYEDNESAHDKANRYFILKMNYEKINEGYKFIISKKEGNYDDCNKNYVLRFRNMRKPDTVIVKYNGNQYNPEYFSFNNDIVINLENINVASSVEVNIIGNQLEINHLNVINDEISLILDDLLINTMIKEKIDKIIFSDMPIKKKRIALRKLRKDKLEPKYINMFISLLEINHS